MRYFAFMAACLLVGFVIGQSMMAENQIRLFEIIGCR